MKPKNAIKPARKGKPPGMKQYDAGLIDGEDKERLIEFLLDGEHDLIPPPRRIAREYFFKTSAKHTEVNYGESCNISLLERDNIDPAKARKCLEYLGVQEPLIEVWLLHYEHRRDKIQRHTAKWDIVGIGKGKKNYRELNLDNKEMYAPVYYRLAGLTGHDLRSVLAHDEKSSAKWKKRLASKKQTWADVRLSDKTIAQVFFELIGRPWTLSIEAIRKRLERLPPPPTTL